MSYLKRGLLASVLILSLLVNWSFAATMPMLNDLPGDAQVIVMTKPLAELSKKAEGYARKLGLPISPEEPLDLGAMLSGQLEVPGVLDTTRGMALVITDLEQAEQSVMAFLPITDPKAVAEALTSSGATPLPDMPGAFQRAGENSVAMISGNYLVMADSADQFKQLATMNKGVKLSASDAKVFADNDIAAVIKLDGVMPKLKQQMLEGLANMPAEAKTGANEQMFNMMIERFSECDAVTIGLRLGDAGINMSVNMLAKSGSTLAGYLNNKTKTTPADLAKLPGSNLIFAGSMAMDADVLSKLVSASFDMHVATAESKKEDIQALKDIINKSMANVNKNAFAIYAPTMAGTPGKLNMCGVYYQENAKNNLEQKKIVVDEFNRVYPQKNNMPAMSFTENAGKIGDLSYHEIVIDFSQMDMEPQAFQTISMFLGPSPKLTIQEAFIKEDIRAIGIGDGMLEQTIKIVKNSTTHLDQNAGIAKAVQNLPPQANIYLFMDIQGCTQMAMQMMMGMAQQDPQMAQGMMMAMGILGQVQGTAGWAATAEGGAVKTEAFIPMETVQSVANIVNMMLQTMGGGMGGGMPPSGSSDDGSTF